MPFRVALTFDAEHPDRPTQPGMAERILATLGEARARATFFVQGRWAEAYPDVARTIPAGGHLVGNHSFYHAHMTRLSEAGFTYDVQTAEGRIKEFVGVDPRPWFRFPFQDGYDRPDLVERLGALGYRSVVWHVEAGDWDRQAGQAHEVENAVVEGVKRVGDGAIVLLHTWPSSTEAALPGILRRLTDGGARFVRVDNLDWPTDSN